MKSTHQLVALLAMLLAASAATAQFVKGNEAVKVLGDGTRRIETAPLPTTGPIKSIKPCAANAACHAGAWHMIETNEGLMECTEVYARPGTCRRSTYGRQKLARLWVVKSGTHWLQCQLPDLNSKCVDVFARFPANLPFEAVQ